MALTVHSEVDWLWLFCTLTLSQPLCHRTGIGPVCIGREGAVGEPQPTCKSDHQTLFQTLRSWCHRPAFCLWCLLTPVHAGSSRDQLRISLDHATLKKPGGIPRRRPRKTTTHCPGLFPSLPHPRDFNPFPSSVYYPQFSWARSP